MHHQSLGPNTCLTCAIAASPSFAVASIHTASVAFSLSASVMRVLLLTSEFFPPVVGETNSARVARWVRCEEPIQATPEGGHPYPRSLVVFVFACECRRRTEIGSPLRC